MTFSELAHWLRNDIFFCLLTPTLRPLVRKCRSARKIPPSGKWPLEWPSAAINVSQHPVGFITIVNCTVQILCRSDVQNLKIFDVIKGKVLIRSTINQVYDGYRCSQIFDEEMLTFKSLLDNKQGQCRLSGWMLFDRLESL